MIYTNICTFINIYIYVDIYTYTHRDRERKRERELVCFDLCQREWD